MDSDGWVQAQRLPDEWPIETWVATCHICGDDGAVYDYDAVTGEDDDWQPREYLNPVCRPCWESRMIPDELMVREGL